MVQVCQASEQGEYLQGLFSLKEGGTEKRSTEIRAEKGGEGKKVLARLQEAWCAGRVLERREDQAAIRPLMICSVGVLKRQG